jgi:hypothetical protein
MTLHIAPALFCAIQSLGQVNQEWLARYNGPASGEDVGNAIAVDSAGNAYVAGYTRTGSIGTGDYLTIKYRLNGDSAWVRTYDGPGQGEDEAHAIAVDRSGNVYVTGQSVGASASEDYATIKYDPNGVRLWVRRYDGSANSIDIARALVLDARANVYVTGESVGSTSFSDFVTVKYDSAGNDVWIKRDSVALPGQDYARAIALNRTGTRVYVTGISFGTTTGSDFFTTSYDAITGESVSGTRYNGSANAGDEAMALVVDEQDRIYVTGFVNDGPGTSKDIATICISPSSMILWSQVYDGPGSLDDIARALVLDDSDNVYITGESGGSTTGVDITTIKYSSTGVEQWVARYDKENATDGGAAVKLDSGRNVYVSGFGGFLQQFVTIKYNPKGIQQWVATSNSSGHGRALHVGPSGRVYVTGNSVGLDPDCVTIKYNQTPMAVTVNHPLPQSFTLEQNYPNPFNPSTRIEFQVQSGAERHGATGAHFEFVSLKVYDLLGREVATLVNEVMRPGSYERTFVVTGLASGVYFYRLKAGAFVETKKLAVVK